MDIYSHLNSKDVAEYLKKIDYQFSAYEMAYIVHRSKTKTLPEKINAMETILSETPDCEVSHREFMRATDSTHEVIKGWIKAMTLHGPAVDIQCHPELISCKLARMLENGHVQLPAPFRRGDIVKDATTDHPPFVFTELKFWNSAALKVHGTILHDEQKRTRDEHVKQINDNYSWDKSDMVAMGYQNRPQEQTLPSPCMIWEDQFGAARNYLDLEYYREPLNGADRILEVVAQHERGELDIESVINFTCYLAFNSPATEIHDFIREEYRLGVGKLLWKRVALANYR